MKVYKLNFFDSHYEYYNTIHFPKGKEFKNFDYYFEKDKKAYGIEGFDKKCQRTLLQWCYDNNPHIYLYGKTKHFICHIHPNGRKSYPCGKAVYDQYILEKKKEKFKKILRNK